MIIDASGNGNTDFIIADEYNRIGEQIARQQKTILEELFMRILYVTTIALTMGFFQEHFKMLINEGHTVELACNAENSLPKEVADLGLQVHHISFSRSPFSKNNFSAIKQLKGLIKNGRYDIVHTHTPNASAIVRLVCNRFRKQGLKVLYTAHGFHFYKGAPLKNWLVYYSVEWLCAHWTDVLITINREDYALAKKRLRAKKIEYVPGVGIDLNKYEGLVIDRDKKRKELGIPNDATLLISVGELNDNKNHETVIKALNGMDAYYIIAGVGDKREHLQKMIDAQKMTERIKLLGYRTDVKELYVISDIYVCSSYREGLSVAIMEAMASGLPCVATRIRGNTDLLDENGGAFFNPSSSDECKMRLESLLEKDMKGMGQYNIKKVEEFSKSRVIDMIKNIIEGCGVIKQ